MSQVTVLYANVRSHVSLIIISPAMILAVLFLFCDRFERCDCRNGLFVLFLSAISQIRRGEKMKSLQHGVFPGGHPSKY